MNTQTIVQNNAPSEDAQDAAGLMKHLPGLLRWVGAAALVFAMYSFLARGWNGGNDVFRYLLMLGHTGLLAVSGLASGHWLKEGKGARLLVTLALVSVPVNFAILGAFVFSGVQSVAPELYPHYVAWTVDSLGISLSITGISLLVLVPVVLLGFTVLMRSQSRKLSALFLFSNLALLLPVRATGSIGWVALVLAVATVWVNRGAARGDVAVKTREGITALSLQVLPMAILLGRSLWLYSADLLLFTVMTLSIYFILRQMALYLPAESRRRGWLEFLSLFPALASVFVVTASLAQIPTIPEVMLLPLGSVVAAAMLYDLSLRSGRFGEWGRYAMVGVLLVSMLLNLSIGSGIAAAVLSLVIGAGISILGYHRQFVSLFVGGLTIAAVAAVQQFYSLFHHFELGSWATMAVLGILSIVVASTIEARGQGLRRRFAGFREHLEDWQR